MSSVNCVSVFVSLEAWALSEARRVWVSAETSAREALDLALLDKLGRALFKYAAGSKDSWRNGAKVGSATCGVLGIDVEEPSFALETAIVIVG